MGPGIDRPRDLETTGNMGVETTVLEPGTAEAQKGLSEEILTDSKKKLDIRLGCLRKGENHRIGGEIPEGWGDCKCCLPDYVAQGLGIQFTPNNKCKGYIMCRILYVAPK